MLKLKFKLRKHKASAIRRKKQIPGILYGHNVDNIMLSVDYKEFAKVYEKAGESSLIKLSNPDKKDDRVVLIHDVQQHPITDFFTHIDFYQVKMDEKVATEVALEFLGSAPAVDEQGGVLIKYMDALEIEALPADLPHTIKVDLDNLKNLGDMIRIKDLDIPDKVDVKTDKEQAVAGVVLQKEEKLEEPEQEEAQGEPSAENEAGSETSQESQQTENQEENNEDNKK